MLYKPYHLEHGVLVRIPTCKSPPERGQLCYSPLLQNTTPSLGKILLKSTNRLSLSHFQQTALWPDCPPHLTINITLKVSQCKQKKLSGHTTQIDAKGPWDEMGEEQGGSCTFQTILISKPGFGTTTVNNGHTNTLIKPQTDPLLGMWGQLVLCWVVEYIPDCACLVLPHLPIISTCATNLDTFALASSLVALLSTRESEWT